VRLDYQILVKSLTLTLLARSILVVACDTNVAFAKRNLFFVLISKVFQNFVHV